MNGESLNADDFAVLVIVLFIGLSGFLLGYFVGLNNQAKFDRNEICKLINNNNNTSEYFKCIEEKPENIIRRLKNE